MAKITKVLKRDLADDRVRRYFKALERETLDRMRVAVIEREAEDGVLHRLQIQKVVLTADGFYVRVR